MYVITPSDPQVECEVASFLPEGSPSRTAVELLNEHFGHSVGLSEAVVIFERSGGRLTSKDISAIGSIRKEIESSETLRSKGDLEGVSFRSPQSLPLPINPYVSQATDKGQAALIKLNIPTSFITSRSARIVQEIRRILDSYDLPAGLNAAVTGASAFGLDYAMAAKRSHEHTFLATVIAVVVILLLMYRAPLAAMIPLIAISIAAFVALHLLVMVSWAMGLTLGLAERIFVIVLLYGAGTDYSLMLISRCREYLDAGVNQHESIAGALDVTRSAILASAGTDTAGLLMLVLADYALFKTSGPAVAIALLVAMLAVLTLVPSLLGIAGKAVFWPKRLSSKLDTNYSQKHRFWNQVARWVTARPGLTLAGTLLVMVIPAVRGGTLTWVYDTLADLDADYGASRGAQMVQHHWPIGEISPVHIMLRSDQPQPKQDWRDISEKIFRKLSSPEEGQANGVQNIRCLTTPLGQDAKPAARLLLRLPQAKDLASKEYISKDLTSMRLEVVLSEPPITLKGMELTEAIGELINAELGQTGIRTEVHLAGSSAEMIDVRSITGKDFVRIAIMALLVIFVIVLILLRDVWLSAFMVASTVLSYFATLGIAYWVFAGLLGAEGLDWKVEVFLFVVMVAVGQDYNIFLAARLSQEARHFEPREATRRAMIHTGPVISSCGVIMAATLGSLMVGDLALLRQLGFALALGMLIDTFVVRPLMLPAFTALTGRTGRKASL